MQKTFIHITVTVLLLIVLMLESSLALSAKSRGSGTSTLKGRVTDFTTQKGILGANILIIGTLFNIQSDENGNYSFSGITPGNYSMRISYNDYKIINLDSVLIPPHDTTILNFELKDYSALAREDIRNGNVHLYGGNIFNEGLLLDEEREITLKYGFTYSPIGCIVLPGYSDYNIIVEEYLDKRNGKGWKNRCDKELEELPKKLSPNPDPLK